MNPRRRTLLAGATLGSLLPGAGLLAAEAPINTPVRIVHGYPGGVVDVVARALADRLAALWKQPVIVDARPGANEILSADAVAKSAADGSTIFLGTEATFAINPQLYKLPYDAATGLVPVTELVEIHLALVTRASLPTPTLAAFVELMRKDGAKHAYATPGVGSPLHLAMESFRRAAGFEIMHVPYKVLPSALQDLMGGRIDAMFIGAMTAQPFVASGKLRVLAVTGRNRPGEVPSFAEAGYPGLSDGSFLGLALPKGAAPALVRRLAADVRGVLRSDDFGKTVLLPNDFTAVGSEPAAFESRIAARRKTSAELIRALNIRQE